MNSLLAILILSAPNPPDELRSPYLGNWNAHGVHWIRTSDTVALVKPTGQRTVDREGHRYNVDEFAVVDGGGTLSAASVSVLTTAYRVFRKQEWYPSPGLDPSRTYLLVARKPVHHHHQFNDPSMSRPNGWGFTECSAEANEVAGAVLLPTSLGHLEPNDDFGAKVMWNIASGLNSPDETVAIASARFYKGIDADFPGLTNNIEGASLQHWMTDVFVPYARKAASHQSPRARFWTYGLIGKWKPGLDRSVISRARLEALDQVLSKGGSLDLDEQLLIGEGSPEIDVDRAVKLAAKTESAPLRWYLLGFCGCPDTESRLQRYLQFLDDPDPSVQDAVIGKLIDRSKRTARLQTTSPRRFSKEELARRRTYYIARLKKVHITDLNKGLPTIIDAEVELAGKG